MKARALLAVVPALLLLVSGCGGGGDDETSAPAVATTPEPATLTKTELLEQGDAICAEVNAAVGTVAASSAEAASRVAQEANLYEGMVERLKGLGTPDDTTGYDEFIGAADTLAQAQSDAALAAARGDSAGLQVAESEASSALEAFQSAADAYGFEECGEAPSAPATPAGGAPASEPEGGVVAEEEEAAPEVEAEAEPEPEETGGAGSTEGGGAETGGGTAGGGTESGGGGGSGGIGPG
jgi:uncharacterized membrane protein YgcG